MHAAILGRFNHCKAASRVSGPGAYSKFNRSTTVRIWPYSDLGCTRKLIRDTKAVPAGEPRTAPTNCRHVVKFMLSNEGQQDVCLKRCDLLKSFLQLVFIWVVSGWLAQLVKALATQTHVRSCVQEVPDADQLDSAASIPPGT